MVSTGRGQLLTGTVGGTVFWWDLSGSRPVERVVRMGHRERITGLAFTAEDRRLISYSPDHSIRVWDVTGSLPREETVLKHEDRLAGPLALSSDGQRLAIAERLFQRVRVLELPSGKELCLLDTSRRVDSLTFGLDGRTLFTGAHDQRLLRWEVPQGRLRQTLSRDAGIPTGLSLSPDGTRLASAHRTHLSVWDAETGQELNRLGEGLDGQACVAWSPDGKSVVSGDREGTLLYWDANALRLPPTRRETTLGGRPTDMEFSLDGRWLALCSDDGMTVYVCEAATGKKLGGWRMRDRTLQLAFAQDGRHLAVGTLSGVIYILRLDALIQDR